MSRLGLAGTACIGEGGGLLRGAEVALTGRVAIRCAGVVVGDGCAALRIGRAGAGRVPQVTALGAAAVDLGLSLHGLAGCGESQEGGAGQGQETFHAGGVCPSAGGVDTDCPDWGGGAGFGGLGRGGLAWILASALSISPRNINSTAA